MMIRRNSNNIWRSSSQQKENRAKTSSVQVVPSPSEERIRRYFSVRRIGQQRTHQEQNLVVDPTASNSSRQSVQAESVIDLTESRSNSVEIISPEISLIDLTSDDDTIQEVTNDLSSIELTSHHSEANGSNVSTCCICLNEQPQFACIPCGHLCLCEDCITEFKRKFCHCPICKERYEHLCKIRMV